MQATNTLDNAEDSIGRTTINRLQQWSQERGTTLPTLGLLALAGGAGMVVGVIAAKGILAAKGVGAVGAVLAQNGANVQGAASVLTGAAALPDKALALINLFTQNAVPLSVGAGVGGATGVGVMRSSVRRATAQRDQQMAETQAARAEASRAQSALSNREAQLDQLQSQLTTTTPATNVLLAIQGIGPVFARRLHEAGIRSLADLAAATPEQVRAALAGLRGGQMANVQDWIDQARQGLAA